MGSHSPAVLQTVELATQHGVLSSAKQEGRWGSGSWVWWLLRWQVVDCRQGGWPRHIALLAPADLPVQLNVHLAADRHVLQRLAYAMALAQPLVALLLITVMAASSALALMPCGSRASSAAHGLLP